MSSSRSDISAEEALGGAFTSACTRDALLNRPLALLPKLVGSASIGLAILDRDLRLCSCNPAWIEAVGCSAPSDDIVPGQGLLELIPGIEPQIESAMEQLLDGKTVQLKAISVEGQTGSLHWDLALVPLVEEGDVVGFLHLVTDVSRRVSARRALRRRVRTCRRELLALRDVMGAASESLELEEVLGRLLDRVVTLMKSEVGAIHLLDDQRTTLRLATSRGISASVLPEIDSVEVGTDLASRPVDWGEPSAVPDIAESLQRHLAVLSLDEAATTVVAPVRSRGNSLGVLSIVGQPGRVFDDGDVAVLASIADQIGVAVENARLYQQAEQLAIVRERGRLARELHDSVTQSLYSLTLLAEASERLIGAGDWRRVREYVGRLGEIAQQALKEMRLLVYQLRPLVLKRDGLVGALQHRLDAVEKRAGVDARLLVSGTVELPASAEEELYRIAQEALNNALKHGAPTSVTVRICADKDGAVLEVVDDGCGFDLGSIDMEVGMGLASMRERTERLGGALDVESVPGEGTSVRVTLEVAG
ncbi:MAG: GAF domain-containing protein [Anaerolineae bacterium]|jgi:signal transduction histidine kinase